MVSVGASTKQRTKATSFKTNIKTCTNSRSSWGAHPYQFMGSPVHHELWNTNAGLLARTREGDEGKGRKGKNGSPRKGPGGRDRDPPRSPMAIVEYTIRIIDLREPNQVATWQEK